VNQLYAEHFFPRISNLVKKKPKESLEDMPTLHKCENVGWTRL